MEWLIGLLHDLGTPWVVGGILILLLFERTGLLQTLHITSSERRTTEREQLSDDIQALVTSLRDTASRERDWRIVDSRYFQEQITSLRVELRQRDETIGRLSEAVSSSERGNARLRHGLANSFAYIAALRSTFRKNGDAPPPYDGWQDMLGIMPDLDDTLRELFSDSGLSPPH